MQYLGSRTHRISFFENPNDQLFFNQLIHPKFLFNLAYTNAVQVAILLVQSKIREIEYTLK